MSAFGSKADIGKSTICAEAKIEAATQGVKPRLGQKGPPPISQIRPIKRLCLVFVPISVSNLVLNVCSPRSLLVYGRASNSAIIWMVSWRIVLRHAHLERSFSVSLFGGFDHTVR